MKKITLVLVLVAVAIFSNQAFSMEKRPATKKAATTKTTPDVLKITGKVTGYSWSNSTITVSTGAGSSLVISIDKSTSISKTKKAIKIIQNLDQPKFLEGLGELVDEGQKYWIKNKLKDEILFLLKLNLES